MRDDRQPIPGQKMLALGFEGCSLHALNNRSESRNDIWSREPSSREKRDIDADRHLKGIFEQVAEGQNVSKKQARDLLAGMVETMTEHLKRGNRIRINGLGTLMDTTDQRLAEPHRRLSSRAGEIDLVWLRGRHAHCRSCASP
jgi:nucleoid DNA-binding protein